MIGCLLLLLENRLAFHVLLASVIGTIHAVFGAPDDRAAGSAGRQAGGVTATVYGEVSEPLLNLLKTHAVGHKWFSFLQGLEPSAVNPAGILVAAREDKQPV